jgi:hypothetical protein
MVQQALSTWLQGSLVWIRRQNLQKAPPIIEARVNWHRIGAYHLLVL